ncbi:MAG TPA: glycosyltransferase [Allosphingosinicella sp.]|nr:glycosyltransferase [Allosphingosinicella sp.]
MRPLTVSVVMAVRNGERYLAEAIASIFGSHRRPLEILLVDGGSTDATVAIAAAQPLTRIVRQQGTGIADAYNLGIASARGDAIAFLSHDDLWADGKLDVQLAAMDADASLMLTVGLVRHVLVGDAPPGFRVDLLGRDVPGFIMETLVARREVFDALGGFDARLATAEDVDWFARAHDAGVRIALLPHRLLTKRIHGSNASLTDGKGTRHLLSALRASVGRKRGSSGA